MSGSTPEITVDELATALQQGATVVDVRERSEYVDGHVPGAVLIPMGQLPNRVTELEPGSRVYLVCASGNRSAAMTDLLSRRGFDAYSVAGGTSGWARSGRAVVTGTAPGA
jgi:rhodanese-related sulfurtransferase